MLPKFLRRLATGLSPDPVVVELFFMLRILIENRSWIDWLTLAEDSSIEVGVVEVRL